MATATISSNDRYICKPGSSELILPVSIDWNLSQFLESFDASVADPDTFETPAHSMHLVTTTEMLGRADAPDIIIDARNSSFLDSWNGGAPQFHSSFTTYFQTVLNRLAAADRYMIITIVGWIPLLDHPAFTGAAGGGAHLASPWYSGHLDFTSPHNPDPGPYATPLAMVNNCLSDGNMSTWMDAIGNAIWGAPLANTDRIMGVILYGEMVTNRYSDMDGTGAGWGETALWTFFKGLHVLWKQRCVANGWGDILTFSHWGRDIYEHMPNPDEYVQHADIDTLAVENYATSGNWEDYTTCHGLGDMISGHVTENFNRSEELDSRKPVPMIESHVQGWHMEGLVSPHDPTNWDGSYNDLEIHEHCCRHFVGGMTLGNETGEPCLLFLDEQYGCRCDDGSGYSIGYSEGCPSGVKVSLMRGQAHIRAMILPAMFQGAANVLNQWGASIAIADPLGSHRTGANTSIRNIFIGLFDGTSIVARWSSAVTISPQGSIPYTQWRGYALRWQSGGSFRYGVYILREWSDQLGEDDGVFHLKLHTIANGSVSMQVRYFHPATNNWTDYFDAQTDQYGDLHVDVPIWGNDVVIDARPGGGSGDTIHPVLNNPTPGQGDIGVDVGADIGISCMDYESGIDQTSFYLEHLPPGASTPDTYLYNDVNMTIESIEHGYRFIYNDPGADLATGIHRVKFYVEDTQGNLGVYFLTFTVGGTTPYPETPQNFSKLHVDADAATDTANITFGWDQNSIETTDGYIVLYSINAWPDTLPPHWDGPEYNIDDEVGNATVVAKLDVTATTWLHSIEGLDDQHYWVLLAYKDPVPGMGGPKKRVYYSMGSREIMFPKEAPNLFLSDFVKLQEQISVMVRTAMRPAPGDNTVSYISRIRMKARELAKFWKESAINGWLRQF